MWSGIYQSPTPPFKNLFLSPIKGEHGPLCPLAMAVTVTVDLPTGGPKRGNEATERGVGGGFPLPLSNKYHIKTCFSNFFIVLTNYLFCLWNFQTISSMNIKSGLNGILPCHTKCRITQALQNYIIYKSKWYDLKSNKKSNHCALIWYQIYIHFFLNKDHI